MSAGFWAISYWFERRGIDPEVTKLVQALVASKDKKDAARFASLVESRVAPPWGGLGDGADAVFQLVSASLPLMSPSIRWVALGLMNRIVGSFRVAGADVDIETKRSLTRVLPYVAGLAQFGDDDLRAEFVDFAALCAALDEQVVPEVSFYLRRLAEAGGDIGASAEVELGELSSGSER